MKLIFFCFNILVFCSSKYVLGHFPFAFSVSVAVESKLKPETQLSKSAEKRKRKRKSETKTNGSVENGKRPKLSPGVSKEPEVKSDKKDKKKKSATKAAAVATSDVEEEVESMTTSNKFEVNDELVPNVDGKKKKKAKKSKKIPTLVPIDNGLVDENDGSVAEGKRCFEWMVDPCKADTFFSDTFEKRPLHIKRGKPDYYKGVLSTKDFDGMLRNQMVIFGKNLDVTSYTNGKRETLNPEGRAYGPGKEQTNYFILGI